MFQNFSIIYFAILIIILILTLFSKRKIISDYLNLYDYPKGYRKKHGHPTSLINGIIILVTLNLILLADYFIFKNTSLKTTFIFLILFNLFFVIGYLDDKKNLTPTIKTFCIFIILLIIIPIDQNLILKNLYFKNFFQKVIILNQSSIFITIFFIYVFYNFMNFSDGLNGITISLSIFFILALVFEKNFITNLQFTLLITLFFCLFFNLLNFSFLGNSGVSLLSIVISLMYIQQYNISKTLLCDEIFVIFLIPGLDLVRLMIERICKGQPFYQGDLNHLHHLLTKLFLKRLVFIIYMIIVILPFLFSKIVGDYKISIFFGIFLYLFVFLFLKNHPKKISI